jgi:AP2-associated kinase
MWDLYRRELVNEKVDLFALGCVLFKAAFGRDAFDEAPCKLQVLNGRYQIPPHHPHTPWVSPLLRRLLTAEPQHRPDIHAVRATVAAMVAAMDGTVADAAEAMAMEEVQARASTPPPTTTTTGLTATSMDSTPTPRQPPLDAFSPPLISFTPPPSQEPSMPFGGWATFDEQIPQPPGVG